MTAIIAGTAVAAAPSTGYQERLLHFAVHVGPSGHRETCDVVGQLFTPAGAGPAHRVPAILTTNGFGGSYRDQTGLAEVLAADGYAVLSYSGLGLGGSSCKITLDSPAYDGEAASQLISFLGGQGGIAFADAAHTVPIVRVDDIIHDPTDHAGHPDGDDPRVGMIGGSYGGEVQFATADLDPRLDTIVPLITWNNLAYSLAPNDANLPPGSVSPTTPGATKINWALLFSADGILNGLEHAPGHSARLQGCPNFARWVCPALLHAGIIGYPNPATTAELGAVSVASFLDRVRIPTMLLQGEDDTIFNLNEAVATYQALRAQGTPVSMIWQSWGHSSLRPAPGEIDLNHPDPATQYETARILAWLDHYLKHERVSTGPGFAYFRDWVEYHGIATPAYATAAAYPVGTTTPWYLSGGGALVADASQVTDGRQAFTTMPAGLPAGTSSIDALGGASGVGRFPDTNLPGTRAAWKTAPLPQHVDVAGEPMLRVQLLAPTTWLSHRAGPAGMVVVFAKIYDVNPGGKASLVNGLVAPARVANTNRPVTITLPAIVHRFAAGHRIELMLSGGDINYRGGLVPRPVAVTTGNTGQVLDLPVVG